MPVSSSRWRRAEDLVEEMGKDIARFTEEGQVVVAGDWNCKIGRLMSVAREMEYNRRNTSKRIDGRGRRMIELMNANEMVILNGIRGSIAQNTCDGARGQGVQSPPPTVKIRTFFACSAEKLFELAQQYLNNNNKIKEKIFFLAQQRILLGDNLNGGGRL